MIDSLAVAPAPRPQKSDASRPPEKQADSGFSDELERAAQRPEANPKPAPDTEQPDPNAADDGNELPVAAIPGSATPVQVNPTQLAALSQSAAGSALNADLQSLKDQLGANRLPQQGEEKSSLSKLATALNAVTAGSEQKPVTAPTPVAATQSVSLSNGLSNVLSMDAEKLMAGLVNSDGDDAELKFVLPSQTVQGASTEGRETSFESRLMAARVDSGQTVTATRTEASLPSLSQDAKLPHFEDPAWLRNIGEKAQMMLKGGQSEIRLRLDPSHLGAIELKVSQGGDGTQITMVATDGRVRDALEAGRNALREQLAGEGVELSQFDVSDQSQQHQRQESDGFSDTGDGSLENALVDTETAQQESVADPNRLVDQRV